MRLITLVVVFFLLYPQNIYAEVQDNGIVVNVIHSYPFAYLDEHKQWTGTHYEYMQAISKKSGVPFDIKVIPRARIIHNLKSGKCDATIMFRFTKRDPFVKYAGIIREIKIIALNKKGQKLGLYQDLYKSEMIGILRTQSVSTEFNNDKNLNIHEADNYPQLVKMLSIDRLDTIVGNAIALTNILNELNLMSAVELPAFPLAYKQQWFQFSNKSNHLDKLEKINEAIETLKQDGTFDTILTRHVGNGWKELNK